jgi:Cys-rich repeat protein
MSSFATRAHAARGVSSCLVGLLVLAGCTQQQTPATFSRPQPKGHTTQAVSTGYPGTATFDAPVVDPNTWSGSPMGTGSWNVSSTPASTGGPDSIGGIDSASGATSQYVAISNFHGAPGQVFAVVSDGVALTVGTLAINNTTLYAGVFDGNTGDPASLATSGTVTLTAAGGIGGRITGTFSGTLDDVAAPPPGCTSSAQCASGEVCVSGTCVRPPPGCTSNAQCSSGQICQAGACVTPPPPGCTSNAQCSSGQVCQSGVCVTAPPPGCTSNAQCSTGQVCQSGVCVTPPPPGCTTNAQCGAGQTCQSGRCVTTGPVSCNGLQGNGSYAGSTGSLAVCTAFAGAAVSVPSAAAMIGDDGHGLLALFVIDPAQDMAGVSLPLSGCPSAPGTVAVSGATFYDQTSSGGTTLYAARAATAASVTYSVVGSHLQGTFSVTLAGGAVSGTFDVQ